LGLVHDGPIQEIPAKNGGNSVKRTLMLLFLLMFFKLALFAQTGHRLSTVKTTEKSSVHVPAQEAPAILKIIYSNLGSATDAYNDTGGWSVAGPNSSGGFTQFIAMPFTPKSDSHVYGVQVAVEYQSGANQVNVSIYNDANGSPGTLLSGPIIVTGLPASGTCCTLAAARFPAVAVAAGTQYWITVDTPISGTGSDFSGGWFWVPQPSYPLARDKGAGWLSIEGGPTASAGRVVGTIP
jgi:hypothetical protein